MRPPAFNMSCLAVCIALSAGSLQAASAAPATQSDGRLVEVVELLLTQRLADVKAAAQEAQQVFQRSADRHREALSLLLLGYSDFVTADFVAAADHLDRSAARLEELGDGLGTWTAVWLSGMLDAKLGRAEQALIHQRRALELARGLGASAEPLSGPGLEPLAALLSLSDDLVRALHTRPAEARPVLAQITELLTRDELLEALLAAGRLDEAEAELPRFAELSRRLEGISETKVAIRLGDLRRRQWRLDEAREIFRQALAGGGRYKTEEQDLKILGNLTELEIAGGRFEEALAWSDQTLARARRRAEPNAVASALVMRAAALKRAQRFDEAELALREALDLWHNAGNAYREATARSQLGFLALRRNRYETAAVEFEAALRLLGEVDAPGAEAQVWIQLFLIYFHFQVPGSVSTALEKTLADSERTDQQLAKARAGLLSALERSWRKTAGDGDLIQHLTILLEQPEVKESFRPEDRRTLLRVLSELWTGAVRADSSSMAEDGDLERGTDLRLRYPGLIPLVQGLKRFQRGELAAARKAWRVALAESPRRELEIQLLAVIGLSFEKEGKIAKAIRSLARAVDAVERMVEEVRVEELLAGFLGSDGTQSLYDRLLALLMRQGRTAEAFDVAERARARAFLLGLGNRRSLPGEGAVPELEQEVSALRRQILDLERGLHGGAAADRATVAARLSEARRRHQATEVRRKVTDRETAARTAIAPLPMAVIQQELPADTTLLSYYVSASRIDAWIVDRVTMQAVSLPIGPAELRRAVCWADRLSRGQDVRGIRLLAPDCDGSRAGSEDVYDQLIAPLRDHLRHPRLMVVPHGALHYLSFAALRDRRTGRHLIEDFTLSYLPSASALHFLRSQETPVSGGALVLGNPAAALPGLEPLAGAEREAAAVAGDLGTTALLGRQATESALSRRQDGLNGEIDLIHVAAHAFFEPRDPLYSRIALTPGEGQDGNLEVHEILAGLDLSGVNLVVLSACRTALGERSGGDEVVGLTRALLQAGSTGVVSTLWDIDDEAAAVLMEELYRRLLAGTAVAEALREAQLALLQGSRYRDPSFWAAFSLAGDPLGRWGPAVGLPRPGHRRPAVEERESPRD